MEIKDIGWVSIQSPGCHDWQRTFVIFPKRTILGRKVWCQRVYYRTIRLVASIEAYDVNPVQDVVQYALPFDMLADPYLKFFRQPGQFYNV